MVSMYSNAVSGSNISLMFNMAPAYISIDDHTAIYSRMFYS